MEEFCEKHNRRIHFNPEIFMDDTELYYDLLAIGAEEGSDIARDIMNAIWEPENIIEED